MRIIHDPDEYEPVAKSTPCTICGGDMTKCNGGCNGSTSFSLVRRSPEAVAAIKAEKRRIEEDEILAKAAVIRATRAGR